MTEPTGVEHETVSPVSDARVKRTRSRVWFVVGALLVLSIGGFFAHEVTRALYVRSQTGSVFADYVIQHHLGKAVISDDSSGFQMDFCVLHLNHPIPQNQLASETFALMKEYHSLDGGISLTLVYSEQATGKTVTQAMAEFLPNQGLVSMTLTKGTLRQTVTKRVNWSSGI